MRTVLPGTNVISNRAAVVLVGASLWFAIAPILAEFPTSALTDFLTGRVRPGSLQIWRNPHDQRGRGGLAGESKDGAPAA